MEIKLNGKGRKLTFKKLDSVSNPKSIHGIYPYRGKISAIDAQQIIKQLPKKGTLLDPFCGSGTIVYEAKKHGMNVVGVDSNPIAIQIAKAKFTKINVEKSLSKIKSIYSNSEFGLQEEMPKKAKKYFHEKTAKEIMGFLAHYEEFNDYEKAAFLGTICLVARSCNHYKWSSTQIGKIAEDKRYVNFYKKLRDKIKKHYHPIPTNGSKLILGDTRQISELIEKNSIDYVYTSPPYFDALDYTGNYTRIIHNIFENNISSIKENLIQDFNDYRKEMKKCFNEIIEVTKDSALIIFVVGDKKKGHKVINGGEFFYNIYKKKPNFIIEREYTGTASKIWDSINKTKRKEQIVLWDRLTW